MIGIIWESGPALGALVSGLHPEGVAIPFEEMNTPDRWADPFLGDGARLLLHVNLPPRRSKRRGLDLLYRLRREYGVTARTLFLSFEEEKTLRESEHGDLLGQPGQGFLRLPATIAEIRAAVGAVSAVEQPQRYWHSAVAAALGLILDGPACDPVNRGPGQASSALSFWQAGMLERCHAVRHVCGGSWWREWTEAVDACRTRLGRLVDVPNACTVGFALLEEQLRVLAEFLERLDCPEAPEPDEQDLAAAAATADNLIAAVQKLRAIRVGLAGEDATPKERRSWQTG